MLRVDQLTYTYPEYPPLVFDFSVAAGAMLGVVGPSGAGKSTLFNLLAGFLVADSGDIRWGDQSVLAQGPSHRPFAVLFQGDNLFEHLSVLDNVGLGLSPRLLDPVQRQVCAAALATLDIGELAQRLPGELSGGQQQRVALARCLVSPRPVMLLDEPFSALDPASREDALAAVSQVNRQGKTVLLITHDAADLERLGAPSYRIGD
ncbi:ATP-binding cassette domain-containing protein [Litorivicinus lipolyticus]|uniref:ATP-binding cassette domain-containing protein n=1 Tax=Litorivicinus lipolyticus TaxID=418701 RepID=A0A5Q2QBN2_9GAMM|nr:ATP-binding cassette domain-containing protein [Litorivicinus lipolyticus]QGG80693.1 ATP-binding cassette domain-containing protein [Litorivicinus lipolyticus]